MAIVRREQDSEPLLKQKNLRAEQYRRHPMQVKNLSQPEHYTKAGSKQKRNSK